MSKVKKIFLTGGSGLLGQALLNSMRHEQVIALCHRSPIVRTGVETVHGDIRKPMLGIDASKYAAMASAIDVVVHCASITQFGVKDSKILETNVDGTREIVKLAKKAAARLIYVSTAFVHHKASELEPVSMYEASKREAEAIAREVDTGFVILRPSIIVGDSKTGEVAAYQGLHDVVGSMVDRSLPVLPATPDMFCDFVAQDWVTDAIWGAVRHPAPPQQLWVTSGKRAMSVEAIVAVAVEVGKQYGFKGNAPRLIPYETLQRLFIPVFLESLPSSLKRRFRANLKLARYMNQTVPLPSSEPYLENEFGLPPRETAERVLFRNMDLWCASRRKTIDRWTTQSYSYSAQTL